MFEIRAQLESLAADMNEAAAAAPPDLVEPASFEVDSRDQAVVLRINTDNGGGPETSHPLTIEAEVREEPEGLRLTIFHSGLDARGWSKSEVLAHLRELCENQLSPPLLLG